MSRGKEYFEESLEEGGVKKCDNHESFQNFGHFIEESLRRIELGKVAERDSG